MCWSKTGKQSKQPCPRCKTLMLKYNPIIKGNDTKYKCSKCNEFIFK